MLKEFRVRNFMNFRDELVFSLQSGKNYEFNNNVIQNGLVKTAAVVGYNASGKSNLGNAILDITNHITDSRNTSVRNGLYTNLDTKDKEAHFSYLFQFDQHSVKYVYDKSDVQTIRREQVWIDGKTVLKKDGEDLLIHLSGAENVNRDNINSNMSLVRYIYANTTLNTEDDDAKIFIKFVEFVKGMLISTSTDIRKYAGFTDITGSVFSLICEQEHGVEELEQFLRQLGISYHLVVLEDEEGKNIYCKFGERTVKLSPLCSSGTRSLVFFFYWYLCRKDIKFMYLDEFDAFYHTELAQNILKILIDMEKVQVIVSTHNTDIITNELLRPDCYYILKDNEITPFYKRTRKALREAHNLQKMYKAGAFNELF